MRRQHNNGDVSGGMTRPKGWQGQQEKMGSRQQNVTAAARQLRTQPTHLTASTTELTWRRTWCRVRTSYSADNCCCEQEQEEPCSRRRWRRHHCRQGSAPLVSLGRQ